MKRMMRGSVVAAAVVLAAGCASRSDVARPQTQDNFGVRMAKMNLWREAMFRFRRAVEINPTDAMAHNNLAVAYEATGDFDAAAKEYREALKLDRSNQYIQKNYSRYVEFIQRSKKREAKPAIAATAPTAAAPVAAPATAPAAVAPPVAATTTTAPPDATPPPPPPVKPPQEGTR